MTVVVLYAMERIHTFTTDIRDEIDTHGTIHNVKGTKVLADSIKGKADLFILNKAIDSKYDNYCILIKGFVYFYDKIKRFRRK